MTLADVQWNYNKSEHFRYDTDGVMSVFSAPAELLVYVNELSAIVKSFIENRSKLT